MECLEERETLVMDFGAMSPEGKRGDIRSKKRDRTNSCYTAMTEWLDPLLKCSPH